MSEVFSGRFFSIWVHEAMRNHGRGAGWVGAGIHFPHKFNEGEKVFNWNSRWESDN